jgi:cytochrome c-type biogenesis protein CcmF
VVGARNPWTLLTFVFAGYTLQVTAREMWLPVGQRRALGEGVVAALVAGGLKQGRRRFGGYVVHVGVVLMIVAIAVSSTMGTSRELLLDEGEEATVGRYTLTFLRIDELREPHRISLAARIAVTREGRDLGVLSPRMNHYDSQREPIGSPAVRSFLFEDLYLSVMNLDAAAGRVGLHVYINPLVGWIWFATGVMAIGGLLAVLPLPRRKTVVNETTMARSSARVPSESR